MTNPARCRARARDAASWAEDGSCGVEGNCDLFLNRIRGKFLVGGDRLTIFAKAVQVRPNRIGGHNPRVRQGVALCDEAGQSWQVTT